MPKNQGFKQKQIHPKLLASARAIVMVLALFILPTQVFSSAATDAIDQKIIDAQIKLDAATAQRKTLQGEVAYFDGQISTTQSEIYQINANISKIQSSIATTEAEIVTAEANLTKARGQLGEIMSTMYEEGQVSNIELIVKSKSFSEFVDRSEYMESINLKVKESTDKIIALKTELGVKKNSLVNEKSAQEKLKNDELNQKQMLADQRYAKSLVLTKTKGLESGYKSLMDSLIQDRINAAIEDGEVIGGSGTGGYPYTGSCGGVDPWRFYKCQCTSYASWKWNSIGKPWTNSRPGQGDAYNWPTLAGDQGYSWGYTPRVGAIAVWPLTGLTPYGHVAYVTGVSGSSISVSEYNWTKREGYGTRSGISGSGLKYIY